jgi:cytochrome c553
MIWQAVLLRASKNLLELKARPFSDLLTTTAAKEGVTSLIAPATGLELLPARESPAARLFCDHTEVEAMHKLSVVLGAVVALGMGSGNAFADVRSGQVIAERWCASCHLVTPDQAKAIEGVPPFAEVAQREDVTPEGLRAFLSSPHPLMPDMALTRDEVRDLVAYIKSLR